MSAQRRVARAAAFAVAYAAAVWAGSLFESADGVSVWWLPAAVLVLWLLAETAKIAVPVALAVRVVASLSVSGLATQQLPRIVLSAVTVVAVYALGVHVHRRLARHRDGLAPLASMALVLGVVTPALVGLANRATLAAAGLIPWDSVPETAATFAVGDATAILAVVPLWTVLAGRAPARSGSTWSLVGGVTLAVSGFLLGMYAVRWQVANERLLFLGVMPAVLASTSRRPWHLPVVLTATGAGLALGFPAVPGLDAVLLQAQFGAVAVLSLLLAGVVASEQSEAPAETAGQHSPPPPARSARQTSSSQAAQLARVGIVELLVRIRWGAAALLVLSGAVRLRTGWSAAPLSVGVAVLCSVGLLLSVNALSSWLTPRMGFSTRRHLVEAWADSVALVLVWTVFAPLLSYQLVPVGTVLVIGAAAIRLPLRPALVLSAAHMTALAMYRILDPLPWSTVPEPLDGADLVLMLLTPFVLVLLIGRTTAALRRSAEQLERAAAKELDLSTRLQLANEALQQEKAALERTARRAASAADQERAARVEYEHFAAVVAHDLMGPMTTIDGMAELLERTDLNPTTATELRARIRASSTRTLDLLRRLHTHARVGTVSLDRREVDLNRIVQDVLHDLAAFIDAAGASVTQPAILARIECDPDLVRQALANLVSNALRHGADRVSGHADITIGGRWGDDGYTLAVSDTGPGIDPTVVGNLFVLGATAGDQAGMGLGLTTCRTIAERHGGRLRIAPTSGHGTTVELLLPAGLPSRSTVLVVEDDEDLATLYARLLRRDVPELVVLHAPTLAEARDVLDAGTTLSAAIVDEDLPDGRGADLLDRLAEAQVPTTVLSGLHPLPEMPVRHRGVPVVAKAAFSVDPRTHVLLGTSVAGVPST